MVIFQQLMAHEYLRQGPFSLLFFDQVSAESAGCHVCKYVLDMLV